MLIKKEGNVLPSLIAVHGVPSSYSRRISFRATSPPVSWLLPLKTVAYVPCAIQFKHFTIHSKEKIFCSQLNLTLK